MGNQTISTVVDGPILSNGDAIKVTASGGINGGPSGVSAENFYITTLSNYEFIDGEAFSRARAGRASTTFKRSICCSTPARSRAEKAQAAPRPRRRRSRTSGKSPH